MNLRPCQSKCPTMYPFAHNIPSDWCSSLPTHLSEDQLTLQGQILMLSLPWNLPRHKSLPCPCVYLFLRHRPVSWNKLGSNPDSITSQGNLSFLFWKRGQQPASVEHWELPPKIIISKPIQHDHWLSVTCRCCV